MNHTVTLDRRETFFTNPFLEDYYYSDKLDEFKSYSSIADIEPLFEYPFIRSMILRLPEAVRNAVLPPRYAMLLGFNEEGKVIYNLQDPGGKYDYITSVLQIENQLYLGSLKEPTFGIYSLD